MKETSEIKFYETHSKSERKEAKSKVSFLLAFLCLWMACFGTFYGVAATFGIIIPMQQYLAVSFLICLFWTVIFQIKRLFGIVFVISIIAYLYVFYAVWDRTTGGFAQIYNAVAKQINEYYQLQLGMVHIEKMMAGNIIWTLSICSFLPAGIFAVGIIKQKKPIIVALLEAFPIVLALIVGLVVPLIPSIAMAFALLGTLWLSNLSIKKKKVKKYVLITDSKLEKQTVTQVSLSFFIVFLLSAIGAVGLGNHILEPKLRTFDYIRENIQNSTMEDLWAEVTDIVTSKIEWLLPGTLIQSGGVSGGKLGNIEEWNNSNKVHLKVYSNETIPHYVYLKAYVGSHYENNEWKPLDNYPDFPASEIQSMGWDMLDSDHYVYNGDVIQTEITVDNVGASSLYSYVPYYSDVREFESNIPDATIKKQGRRSRIYPARVVNTALMLEESIYHLSSSSADWLSEEGEFSQNQYEWYNDYNNWVYEQYLQLPEHGIEKILEDYGQEAEAVKDREDIVFIKERVQEILEDHAVYSTKMGVTPDGEDFNEYFLYEQKKGVCMHFASAATILFRMFGVPARYVEGYIVPGIIAEKENEVLDSHAHAWVEVWNGAVGWMPVEVTPGYENEPTIVPAQSEAEKEENTEFVSEEESSFEAEKSTEIQRETEAEEQNSIEERTEKYNSWTIVWSVAGVSIIIVVFLVIIQKWRYNKLRQTFIGPKRLAIAEIAAAMRKIQEVSHQTWQECGISQEEMEWFQQTALKARFSEHPVDRKEVQRAVDLYLNLAEQIWQKAGVWVKIKIRWVYCLK
ncbi:MAG: transglutaminase family protein [Candidatus Fimimorpha sp.]